jgi:hypothetical protein
VPFGSVPAAMVLGGVCVEEFAHAPGELVTAEGFLEERDAGFVAIVPDYGVVGVAGHATPLSG